MTVPCKSRMQAVRTSRPYTNGNVANGCGSKRFAGGGGGSSSSSGGSGGGMASATQPPYRAAWGPAPAPAPLALRYPPPPFAPPHPHPHPPLHALPPLHAAAHTQYASSGRVPTAASPSNTASSSSSATGSQSGTMSTSLSNNANASSEQLSRTNLYIRGLPHTTTDKDLVNMCHQYGNIVSTKAILDKNTNKCKGYGFVDFDNVASAEAAVKGLQAKGIQAQMAKVGIWLLHRPNSQQEQDPTNLYMANLPPHFKENDVDQLLARFGQVISTRILRDPYGHSKGVGFARMESKDKCEKIIQMFNGNAIEGHKDPLLVKFADGGGNKKKQFKTSDRTWRDNADLTHQTVGSGGGPVYGCGTGADIGMFRGGVYLGGYPMTSHWLPAPPYPIMQPTHIPAHQIDPDYAVQVGRGDRTVGLVMPDAQPYQTQLLSQMGTVQLVPHQFITPYGYMGSAGPSLMHSIEPDHSTAASPDEPYQQYSQK